MNPFPMCPLNGYWSIAQGVLQGNRIGNVIKTRKCFLNYILRPNSYDAITNPTPVPLEVQLFLGHTKSTPTLIPVALDINQLFQAGSSVAAPIGQLRDIISIVNTDYWVIKKRWTHKVGYAENGGSGGAPNSAYFANNDFKMNTVKRLNITNLVPAKIQFNDAGITPTSKNLFFFFQAVSASGTILPATTAGCNIDYWIDFHYEDA